MTGRLSEHFRFIGPKILLHLGISAASGIALGVVEIAFSYALQAFLVTIGVLHPDNAMLPGYLLSLSLGGVFGLIAAVGLLRGLLLGVNYYFQGSASEEFLCTVRSRLIHWALHSDSASSSEVTSLFNARAVGAVAAIYAWQALITQAPIILLLGFTLVVISPLLTVSAAVALLVMAPMMLWIDARLKETSTATISDWDRANARLLMSMKNLLLLQIYGMEQTEDRLAQESLRRYRIGTTRRYALAAAKNVTPQILGLVVVSLVALIAKKHALLAPGVLASYFYLFLRLVQSSASANAASSDLVFGLPHYRILLDWWRRAQERAALTSKAEGPAVPGGSVGWRLDDVSFRYADGAAKVFDGFSATLKPGQTAVITGPSGTGKSTLLGLLLGNLRPMSGTAELLLEDGKRLPLEQCRAGLVRRVGYVGPESFLVEGTVYDNLVYGVRHKPSDAEVEEALRLAECQFLLALPKGLQHRITEQGQGLSAGQKQRLSLARALLRRPTVLILDEATSNLDMETEARLVDTLAKLKGSMTIVAVTHRRELLRIADMHLELEGIQSLT